MTVHAREVLKDCEVAINEIHDGVMGRQWRIRWIGAIALLRAVGHVLNKVDTRNDSLLQTIVDKAWKRLASSKPDPTIFWQFIEKERNSILKEYQSIAGQGVTVRPGTLHINLQAHEQRTDPSPPTLYHYTINKGPYKGRDQREVYQEGINWWDAYLREIESEYRRTKP